MTNVGTSGVSLSLMKAATSLMTTVVVPVRPQSDLVGALRPQPRWSQAKT